MERLRRKRSSCLRCLLIKRMGFGQGGSCRCLQNKEGGGRPEASLGPGVSAVPARLVWARPCPWAGHRRCPCCKRSTGREAGGGSTPGQASPEGPAQGSVCRPAAPRCPVSGSARLSPQRRRRGVMKSICHRKARHRFSAKPSPGLSQETAYKIPNNDLMAYFLM